MGLYFYKEVCMLFTDIQKLMNTQLAGETLTFKEMLPHLDFAIDEINSTLNTTFPTFTEVREDNIDAESYDCFPDKYIRTVVVPGAAWNFYVVDEEGLQTSPQYQTAFEKGKFIMQRDSLYSIPEEYLDSYEQGFIEGNPNNDTLGVRGLELDLNF